MSPLCWFLLAGALESELAASLNTVWPPQTAEFGRQPGRDVGNGPLEVEDQSFPQAAGPSAPVTVTCGELACRRLRLGGWPVGATMVTGWIVPAVDKSASPAGPRRRCAESLCVATCSPGRLTGGLLAFSDSGMPWPLSPAEAAGRRSPSWRFVFFAGGWLFFGLPRFPIAK